MNDLNNRINRITVYILRFSIITVLSFITILIYTNFKPNIFVVDDNYNQWLPIIEKNYDSFLENGRMPVYDFYQMGGMSTADEGYYGQQNAIMFMAYLIGRVLLQNVNTITVYIIILFSLGNICFYSLLRYMRVGVRASILITAMYVTCGAYVAFSYWYYIWGNYLLVPLIIFAITYCVDSKNFFAYIFCGIILAFSLSLGNIQYSFYHYMVVFFIFFVVFLVCRKKEILLKFFSNISIGVLLSAPFLIIQLEASARRASFIDENRLLLFPISSEVIRKFSLVPVNAWLMIKDSSEASLVMIRDRSFCGIPYSYIYVGFLAIGFIGTILLGIYKTTNGKRMNKQIVQYSESVVAGSACAAIFFMLFSMGEEGGVAGLLCRMPVVSQFQLAFKAVFVFVPLCAVSAVYFLRFMLIHIKYKFVALFICMAFIISGGIQNYWILNSGVHTFFRGERVDQKEVASEITEKLQKAEVDLNNYRVVSFLNTKSDDPWEKDTIAMARRNHLVTNNMATRIGAFTLGGYEPSLQMDGFNMCDHIMVVPDYCYDRANAVSTYILMKNFEHMPGYYDKFVRQICDNSVKYLLFKNNESQCKEFIDYIEKHGGIEIENIKELFDDTCIVILKGIPSLCSDSAGMIKLSSTVDSLDFEYKAKKNLDDVRLSFRFDKTLKAFYYDVNNRKNKLNIAEDDNHYIRVSGFPVGESVRVYVEKEDYLATLSIILGYVSFLMLLIMLIGMSIKENFRLEKESIE